MDANRARRRTEEWFKTACASQQRQHARIGTLLVAFALLAPIATRLPALRWRGRNHPDRPVTDVLDVQRNIVPGWQVIGRGYRDLSKMVELFRSMKVGGPRCEIEGIFPAGLARSGEPWCSNRNSGSQR